MKRTLSAALVFSLAVVVSAAAAEKAHKKKAPATPSTVPPTSAMISLTPPDPGSKESGKLLSSEMSGQDLQFFTSVVDAGRTQGFLIDLLKTKGQSDKLKALADALADAQAQENKQVARLAATKGWPVSTEPTLVQRAIGAQLEKQAGPDFDKEVMDRVIAATQESVAAYEAAAKSNDKDIKSFSEQMLPVAREKLQLVERLTGAGKSASKLLRTGEPPKVAPPTAPSPAPEVGKAPGAEKAPGATPPAIIPSKPKAPAATPAVKQATIPGASAATPAAPDAVSPVNH